MKVRGNLGCDQKMEVIRNMREWSRAENRVTILDFRRVDFGLFEDLTGRAQGRAAKMEHLMMGKG